MKFVIDADACPKNVLNYVISFSRSHGKETVTVANFNHVIESDLHICVGNESQAADIKVANITEPGDIVVTQDWGLASLILAKKAFVISPGGRIFDNSNIDFLLEEREIKAKFRRSGGRTKGPSKRTEADDNKFIKNFNELFKRALATEMKSDTAENSPEE